MISRLSDVLCCRHGHFYGEDTIRVSARNSNGKNDIEIGVLVDPINDPPFIHAPKSILLKSHGSESRLYDKNVDKFEFTVGDPDLQNFPGTVNINEIQRLVHPQQMLSFCSRPRLPFRGGILGRG